MNAMRSIQQLSVSDTISALEDIAIRIKILEETTQEINAHLHSTQPDFFTLSPEAVLLQAARNLSEAIHINTNISIISRRIQNSHLSASGIIDSRLCTMLSKFEKDSKTTYIANEEVILDLLDKNINPNIRDRDDKSATDYLNSIAPNYLSKLIKKSTKKHKTTLIKRYSAPTIHQALLNRERSVRRNYHTIT